MCVGGGDRKVEILPVIMLKTISSRTVLFEAFPPPITSLLGTKTSVINARYTVQYIEHYITSITLFL